MNKFKYHFLGALVFMGTIVSTYIGYAIWTNIPTQQAGETMTADIWNNMATSVNAMASTVNGINSTINTLSTKLSGTYTSGKMCISDSTGKIQCNTDIPSGGSSGGGIQNSQTFTSNGNFVVPVGVTSILVVVFGGQSSSTYMGGDCDYDCGLRYANGGNTQIKRGATALVTAIGGKAVSYFAKAGSSDSWSLGPVDGPVSIKRLSVTGGETLSIVIGNGGSALHCTTGRKGNVEIMW